MGSITRSFANNILTAGKLYRIVVSNFSGTGNAQYFTTQKSNGDNTYNINVNVANSV